MQRTPVKFNVAQDFRHLLRSWNRLPKILSQRILSQRRRLSASKETIKLILQNTLEQADSAKNALASCGNIKGTHKAAVTAAIDKMVANAKEMATLTAAQMELGNDDKDIHKMREKILILKADHGKELYEQEKRHTLQIVMIAIQKGDKNAINENEATVHRSNVENNKPSTSYAEATNGKSGTRQSPTAHTMNKESSPDIISPIEKTYSIVVSGKSPIASETLEKTIKENINVTSLGIGIKKIKQWANNRVYVQCDTEEQCKKFSTEVSKG